MTEEKKKERRNMLVVQWVGGIGVSNWEGCAKHHATSFDPVLVVPINSKYVLIRPGRNIISLTDLMFKILQ